MPCVCWHLPGGRACRPEVSHCACFRALSHPGSGSSSSPGRVLPGQGGLAPAALPKGKGSLAPTASTVPSAFSEIENGLAESREGLLKTTHSWAPSEFRGGGRGWESVLLADSSLSLEIAGPFPREFRVSSTLLAVL